MLKVQHLIDPAPIIAGINAAEMDEETREYLLELFDEAPVISALDFYEIRRLGDDAQVARFGLGLFKDNHCRRWSEPGSSPLAYRCSECRFAHGNKCLINEEMAGNYPVYVDGKLRVQE